MPGELGDRPTHRVADGDEAVDAESVGEGGSVVGAVGQTEAGTDGNTLAVAPVIEGQHVEVTSEGPEGREPVEVGVGPEPVEEDDGRCARGTGDLAHEGAAATRKIDVMARWQWDRRRERGLRRRQRRPPPSRCRLVPRTERRRPPAGR